MQESILNPAFFKIFATINTIFILLMKYNILKLS